MPQLGWKIWFGKDEGWVNYSFDEVIEWAKSYPANFHYSPATLRAMRRSVEHARKYLSPTMLSSCPRQEALERLLDYYVPVNQNWALVRGNTFHSFVQRAEQEEGAVTEQHIRIDHSLPDGTWAVLGGTPDKYVVSDDGLVLIDYKTVDAIVAKPKASWIQQLSVYAYMLFVWTGKPVVRAFIEQVGMKDMRRLEVELWPFEKVISWLNLRIPVFIPILSGEVTLDTLPPMLDPVLDEHEYWMCNSGWCPVETECKALALRSLQDLKKAKETLGRKLPVPSV